jgi:antitoxin (DNA-binding transcriptional repressor) of toxin-antitoxin stability system
MKRVKIAALKDQLSRHLRAVERGMTLEVTDRDRPIARIVPVPEEDPPLRLIPPRRSFALLRRKRYARANWGVSSLDLLREERRER